MSLPFVDLTPTIRRLAADPHGLICGAAQKLNAVICGFWYSNATNKVVCLWYDKALLYVCWDSMAGNQRKGTKGEATLFYPRYLSFHH